MIDACTQHSLQPTACELCSLHRYRPVTWAIRDSFSFLTHLLSGESFIQMREDTFFVCLICIYLSSQLNFVYLQKQKAHQKYIFLNTELSLDKYRLQFIFFLVSQPLRVAIYRKTEYQHAYNVNNPAVSFLDDPSLSTGKPSKAFRLFDTIRPACTGTVPSPGSWGGR